MLNLQSSELVVLSNHLIVFAADYLAFFGSLAVPYLLIKHKQHDLIRIMATVAVAYVVSGVLKDLLSVPRPFVTGDFEPLIAVSKEDFYGSFPSGHAATLAAFGAAVFYADRSVGRLLVALAGVVGLGRVLAGVHSVFDVVGGLLIGIVIAWVFELVRKRFSD